MSAKKLQNKNFTFNEMSEEQISSELLAKHIFFFNIKYFKGIKQIANMLKKIKQEKF